MTYQKIHTDIGGGRIAYVHRPSILIFTCMIFIACISAYITIEQHRGYNNHPITIYIVFYIQNDFLV